MKRKDLYKTKSDGTIVRLCSVCKVFKPLDRFPSHKKYRYGKSGTCKICEKVRCDKWKEKNREHYHKKVSEWGIKKNTENPQFYHEKYLKRKERGTANGKYDARKTRTHELVSVAIANGFLKKMLMCERCGSEKNVEAHHEDYSKPLDVKWFCHKCHMIRHSELKGCGISL